MKKIKKKATTKKVTNKDKAVNFFKEDQTLQYKHITAKDRVKNIIKDFNGKDEALSYVFKHIGLEDKTFGYTFDKKQSDKIKEIIGNNSLDLIIRSLEALGYKAEYLMSRLFVKW